VRLLLLVNASAASVTPRARVVIQKALAADHRVTVAETSRRGHAARLAQGAAADGFDAVVVLGGDGTLNEAANGLAHTDTALGILPGGSTNVFARTIGMTNDPIEATGELLSALGSGSIRPISLGTVNGRYFLFHVGLGFDAAVVARVERRGALKRYAGHALFVSTTFTTWLRHYDRRHPAFTVSFPPGAGVPQRQGAGVPRHQSAAGAGPVDGYFGICLKTDPYTFLGERPLRVAPGTGFDSGLAMVTFRRLDLLTMLPLGGAALSRRGRGLAGRRGVSVVPGLDEVVVKAHRDLPYQADGDYLGEAARFELRCEQAALRLILPPQATTPSRRG
jgi:diacylglycerol kinase family enzyme